MHTSKEVVISRDTTIILADHEAKASEEKTQRADGVVVSGSKSEKQLHEVEGSKSPTDDKASQQQAKGVGGEDSRDGAPQEKEGGKRQRRGRGRSESRHPIYTGVRKRRGGKWVSEIREPGKKTRVWLGTFPTPEMAARAYDVASFNLKKPYAFLNFPASASSLPIPQSCSPKHIQEAAAAAAASAAFQSRVTTDAHAGEGGLVPTSQIQLLPPASSSSSSSSSSAMSMAAECMQDPLSSSSNSFSQLTTSSTSSFLDEDMIFDMPNVITDMAHGLMITPPFLYHSPPSNGDNGGGQSSPSLWED